MKHAGSILIAIAGLCVLVSIVVAPHCMRTLSENHALRIASTISAKPLTKFRALSAADMRSRIQQSHNDTVVVHLWDSWSSQGTALFGRLQEITRHSKGNVEVFHLCTDMAGLRQRRASSTLSAIYGIQSNNFGIRSQPNLFDLHNEKVTQRFVSQLVGSESTLHAPAIIVMNRQCAVLWSKQL